MLEQATRHRFTVVEYHLMAEAGILAEDDRVELIEGEIVDMAPIGSRHHAVVSRLTELLVGRATAAAIVHAQGSVRLSELSEPQPDLVLLKRRADYYASEIPGPADVLLIIEAADSSLDYDRDVKSRLYAAAGIREYWLVDIEARRLLVHRRPSAAGYGSVEARAASEELRSEAVPDLVLAADDIFVFDTES